MDNPFQSSSVLSFCPGILGLERGLERVVGPTRVVAYVEIEAFIIANLIAGMEAGVLAPAPVWTNVKSFDARPFRGKIHGFIGGYPCQPFSAIGEQKGIEDHRHLYPYLSRSIEAIGPVWCYFENVVNHINIGYDTVRADLQRLGYTVKEGIYSALEAGATHTRERLFILAVDHSKCEGLQRHPRTGGGAEGWANKNRPDSTAGIFPRERGLSQWDWEQPRTLNTQSGVGCTINGYNFREDLLRAYGNSVVEQVAEIAFIDLLSKHFG